MPPPVVIHRKIRPAPLPITRVFGEAAFPANRGVVYDNCKESPVFCKIHNIPYLYI